MFRRRWRVPLTVVLAFAALLLWIAAAGASVRPAPRAHPPPVRGNPATQLHWNGGFGSGENNVSGFLPTTVGSFDPVNEPYPASNPTTADGFTPVTEYFAGVVDGVPTDGSPTLGLYCIDIRTDTLPGFGYFLSTWDAAQVPDVGYVARILADYYPNTSAPATLASGAAASDSQKGAAVQAAIWFFSDGFVVSTSSDIHDTVVAIVNEILAEGPITEQPPPTLSITPDHASGAQGSVLGPFTVTTATSRHRVHRAAPSATVTATGATMYSDAAGTTLLGDGTTATVSDGQQVWLRSTGPSSAVLQATAVATVPAGDVYLYDGLTPGYGTGQKLIMARTATLTSDVQGIADFLPPGSLLVTKRIAGPAAGSQGEVVIDVNCDDGVSRDPLIVPAATRAGVTSKTYTDIPEDAMCTVDEREDGGVAGRTAVDTVGDGQAVDIPSGGTDTVNITDTYRHVDTLIVHKTIAGPGAGRQGEIRIRTRCRGMPPFGDFVIPAHASAGEKTKLYHDITAPTTCVVTETVDGHNSMVSVVVEGSGQRVFLPPDDVVNAYISDTYGLLPGQLEVTKTIAGPLAGQQGTAVIHTVCNGTALTPDFMIRAGTPAGDESQIYSGVPTPARCVVTEITDGHTSAVPVIVAGSPRSITIPPGRAGAAQITDTYGPAPGSLFVTKTIAGPEAGHQGPVTIRAICNGTAVSPGFVIPAGTRAGNVTHSFDGIPAGSVCSVDETADGATATVMATVSGDGQKVTVPAGKVVPVNMMDVYDGASGVLKVTKTVAGPAAPLHARIAVVVACGGPLHTFAFNIPARTGRGSVSRYFDGLPAGARCKVTEAADGHTATVAVVASGNHNAAVPAGGMAIAHITDSFALRATEPTFTG